MDFPMVREGRKAGIELGNRADSKQIIILNKLIITNYGK